MLLQGDSIALKVSLRKRITLIFVKENQQFGNRKFLKIFVIISLSIHDMKMLNLDNNLKPVRRQIFKWNILEAVCLQPCEF